MSKLPVSDPKFWYERLIRAAATGKELHTVIYNTNYKDWVRIQEEIKAIVNRTMVRGGKLLDVGCGYGVLSELVHETIDYTGIDIAPDLIEIAKTRNPNGKFHVMDATKLLYPDKEFDLVVFVSIKKMIVNNLGEEYWLKMYTEALRVAKHVLIIEYEGKVTFKYE